MLNNIIEELRADNSGNYKLEVLEKYKDNQEWLTFLKYVYNPHYNYYIRKIQDYVTDAYNTASINDIFIHLDKLRAREITGTKAIEETTILLQALTQEDSHLLILALDRDIKCNVGIKSINKIYKNLIPEIPYQRCSALNDKTIKNIDFSNKAFLQLKLDASFLNITKDLNGTVKFLTRNGTEFTIPFIEKKLSNNPLYNYTIMGEIGVKEENGDWLDRKTSNGLINKYIKKEATMENLQESYTNASTPKQMDRILKQIEDKHTEYQYVEDNIDIICWDVVTYEDWIKGIDLTPYYSRLNDLDDALKELNLSCIKCIDTTSVESIDEANELNQRIIDMGYEGSVLKDKNMIWENKTSKHQIKLKAILDADLLCVDVIEGKDGSKYEGKIGSLVLVSSCGGLKVNCGSGLNDELREMSPSYFIGRVIEVKYNELITSKGKDTSSLFLPRFIEVREDKDIADTLERLIEG